MNTFPMRVLIIIAIIGMISYLELLEELWRSVSVNPEATFDGFFMNYGARIFGGSLVYLILAAVVLIFKGRSFKRYIISVFVLTPVLFYLGVLGAS